MKVYRTTKVYPTMGFRVTPEMLQDRRFLAPHMTLQSFLDLIPDESWVVGITLRDPVKRLRSSFHYFKQKPMDHVTGVGRLLSEMTYDDFLASEDQKVCGLKDNVQTRFIGGDRFGSTSAGRNTLSSSDLSSVAEEARRRCEANAFVPLLLDYPEQSLQHLAEQIGYTGRISLPHKNKTKGKSQVRSKSAKPTKAELRWLEADIALYESLAARFKR